jgi:hypothetical protein
MILDFRIRKLNMSHVVQLGYVGLETHLELKNKDKINQGRLAWQLPESMSLPLNHLFYWQS